MVAISGAGSRAFIGEDQLSFGDPNLSSIHGDISRIAEFLDAPFIVGFMEGGDSSFVNSFIDEGAETVTFTDGDDAFDYLKRIIASGHSVNVHLNVYHIYDDFAMVSDWWKSVVKKGEEPGGSTVCTVTGYDEEYVYINDTKDPTEAATNLPARINTFRLAWEQARTPNYMFYLSGTGNEIIFADIIAWNVELAEQAQTAIRYFTTNTYKPTLFQRNLRLLAVGRLRYADFLEKNGYEEAAALYRESGNLLVAIIDKDNPIYGKFENLNTVADLEEQVIGLLPAVK